MRRSGTLSVCWKIENVEVCNENFSENKESFYKAASERRGQHGAAARDLGWGDGCSAAGAVGRVWRLEV